MVSSLTQAIDQNQPRRSNRTLSESRAAADCIARLSGPTASLSMSCACPAAVRTSSSAHDGDSTGTDTCVMPCNIVPQSTAKPDCLASLTRARKSPKDGLRYQATRENSAASSASLPLPKAAMITPEAPAGPGYCRPTVTERSVRNAAPTQSSSSSDDGPSTLDRYTDTPCVSDTASISGRA